MSELDTPDTDARRGIDRRRLIKGAAAAGVAAWTAPVIIDSLTSPAAAITCSTTCFQFQIAGTCGSGTVAVTPATCPIAGEGCITTTNVAPVLFGSVCVAVNDCEGDNTQFTLTATGTCWTAGTCAATRRVLAAVASLTNGSCILGTINGTGTQVNLSIPRFSGHLR